MGTNSLLSINEAPKVCPVVHQIADINQGIAQEDFRKVMLNAGILALYTLPIGSTSKGFKLGKEVINGQMVALTVQNLALNNQTEGAPNENGATTTAVPIESKSSFEA